MRVSKDDDTCGLATKVRRLVEKMERNYFLPSQAFEIVFLSFLEMDVPVFSRIAVSVVELTSRIRSVMIHKTNSSGLNEFCLVLNLVCHISTVSSEMFMGM